MAKVTAAHWRRLKASPALDDVLETLSRRYIEEFDEADVDDISFGRFAAEIRGARRAMADVKGYIEARLYDIEADEREASAAGRAEPEAEE